MCELKDYWRASRRTRHAYVLAVHLAVPSPMQLTRSYSTLVALWRISSSSL